VSNRERILVVDDISDTADVLQAVLEPRGVTVNRISRWHGPDSPLENRPAVVVVDAESHASLKPPEGGNWDGVPQIIIGTMRVNDAAGNADSTAKALAEPDSPCRYLQKPFQFAELVQAIEALIAPRH